MTVKPTVRVGVLMALHSQHGLRVGKALAFKRNESQSFQCIECEAALFALCERTIVPLPPVDRPACLPCGFLQSGLSYYSRRVQAAVVAVDLIKVEIGRQDRPVERHCLPEQVVDCRLVCTISRDAPLQQGVYGRWQVTETDKTIHRIFDVSLHGAHTGRFSLRLRTGSIAATPSS